MSIPVETNKEDSNKSTFVNSFCFKEKKKYQAADNFITFVNTIWYYIACYILIVGVL